MNTKATLTILFGVSVAIANVLAAKLAWFTIPVIGPVPVPAGFIPIAVGFHCSNLLVEFEGKEYTTSVVNSTLVALAAVTVMIELSIRMPVAPFYQGQEAYATVLSSSTAVLLASFVTIAISQHVDVRLFAGIRKRTGAGHKWMRDLGSTAVSQWLDTVLFITLAFGIIPFLQGGEPQSASHLVVIITGQYVVKMVIAVIDTPVFYAVTAARERGYIEGEPA
jgi:uncharacterized integral membrane protein (TIGR00697 family)